MTETKVVNFRVTPEMELMLAQLQKRTGCKDTSETIRTAIRDYHYRVQSMASA